MTPIAAVPANFTNFTAPLTMRPLGADLERTNSLREAGFAAGGTQAAGPDAFGSLMKKFVNDVDGKMKTSATEKNKIMTGESTNLHQAMIASQESSVAFTLMVELRNKLVESYQELMRAQV
jgi:flagellar hook-basal body complex protein FliE